MAHGCQPDYLSQRIAVQQVSVKSRSSGETRRNWLRQAERDCGKRPGLTTNARAVEPRADSPVRATTCGGAATRFPRNHARRAFRLSRALTARSAQRARDRYLLSLLERQAS
jgi:hypothetical protein